MRLYGHNVHAWRFPVALVRTSSIFILSFACFFQLRLRSQSTYNHCRSSTFACTGQRLARARVVLWFTLGLASMKHFEFFPSDTYTSSGAVFFIYDIHLFSGMFFFHQSQPWTLWIKLYFNRSAGGMKAKSKTKLKKTTAARLIRTCDTCAHTYILHAYVMTAV